MLTGGTGKLSVLPPVLISTIRKPKIGDIMQHRNCTNADVVKHAVRGETARSSTGNMSAELGPPALLGIFASSWLHDRLNAIIRENRNTINLVIYSYNTPIAWLDRGAWVVPDARYSATTGSKHQTHLYMLPNRVDIPEDCGLDEYETYVSGQLIYSNGKITKGAA